MTDYCLGLTGYPLAHSFSPRLHNAALAHAGLAGEYGLYPVSPGDQDGLAALIKRLRKGELHGLNVTVPHKQAVIPLLDELTPTARAIGAVNTIFNNQKSIASTQLSTPDLPSPASGSQPSALIIGDNTDAPGFFRDMQRFMGENFGQRPFALVLGAGGSARAVVYALAQAGWEVTVAARRLAQAEELVAALAGEVTGKLQAIPLCAEALRELAPGLLVNCTPLGMVPCAATSPWPEELPLPETAVYDLIYNPTETGLVQAARAAGLPATTGLGMLLEQAALAFTCWTGVEVDFRTLDIGV